MKKKISAALLMSFSLSSYVTAQPSDPLHIIGNYTCTGYDNYDGHFKGDLTLTLDEQASQFKQSFGAYQFKLLVDIEGVLTTYSGFAAAQGQSLAMYFANDSQEAPTDRGVGMALVSHDQDANGAYTTTLHKSYYLPYYMRTAKEGRSTGGHGTEVCVKKIGRPV